MICVFTEIDIYFGHCSKTIFLMALHIKIVKFANENLKTNEYILLFF
jgi:hypothetical protein